MLKIKSFQRRIFLALLAVGLLPAILLLLAGTGAVHWVVSSTGTAGPWGSVAESGQALLDQVEEAEVTDPDMVEAADTHRLALSESLRNSQILTLVADRILALLPLMAVALVLVVGGLAYLAARQLSRGFSRPIQDLVGWTNLIAKGQPLPAPGPADTRGVQEFAALRGALRKMAHELEKGRRQAIQNAKLRSWNEMARRVAHELKNPLTPMRMAAVTATRSQAEDVREAGKVLMEEISRLDEMARTFSQFGRMPEGPPARVDLLELLQGLVSQHQGIGPPIQFESPSPLPPILGHFDALQRCFRNLLLNAIDAARDHGRVEVRSWAEGGEVVTEILDRGPGIPPEALDRVWDPDFTTKSSGTGLGLPLVRQTILAHHGRVEGRNHPEGGAVFRVVLPVNPPDQGPTTTP
jgi:signal transduction histidine kinase